MHFLHRRVQDIVIILEEVNLSHPWFIRCNMLVPWEALSSCHPNFSQCNKEVEQKRRSLTAEEMRAIVEQDFRACSLPFTLV